MSDRKSSFRRAAEDVVRLVLKRAAALRLDAKAQRRVLRESFKSLLKSNLFEIGKAPRHAWYEAVRAVTGGGVLDLADPRQESLPIHLGSRQRRRRPRHA